MPSWLRELLREHEERVDSKAYAASLFYVRHDEKHYRACKRNIDRHDH